MCLLDGLRCVWRHHRSQLVQILAHAHRTALVMIDALGQLLDPLVAHGIAFGLLGSDLPLIAGVRQE